MFYLKIKINGNLLMGETGENIDSFVHGINIFSVVLQYQW